MFLVLTLLLPAISVFVSGKILGRTGGQKPAQLAGGGGAPPLHGLADGNTDNCNPNRVGGGIPHRVGGPLRGSRPLRTFLKNYAFVLATSLALTYLLAAGVVSRLSVVDILLGRLGFFNTEILTLSAVLLAANLVAASTIVVALGGGEAP